MCVITCIVHATGHTDTFQLEKYLYLKNYRKKHYDFKRLFLFVRKMNWVRNIQYNVSKPMLDKEDINHVYLFPHVFRAANYEVDL